MPANGEFLIDTNALIRFLARDPSLRWRMGHDFRCFVSFITVGELYAGAHQSSRQGSNIAEVQRICTDIPVIEWDMHLANEYGRIQAVLRRKGTSIPQNDIWIAATAVRHEMTLITLDKHFTAVEGLPVEIW
jgi:tRNA(fMet)-specific endonuclease VapC